MVDGARGEASRGRRGQGGEGGGLFAQQGESWDIYAQRYDNEGNPLGTEFRVNTVNTANSQLYSAIAMNDAGEFVITWTSFGHDGDGWGVFAQRFDSQGIKVGDEVQVNTQTTDEQRFSSVV